MAQRALITGIGGQDGYFVAHDLHNAGFDVFGTVTAPRTIPDLANIATISILDIRNTAEVDRSIAEIAPDVIIHLAAQSNVGASWQDPSGTAAVNVVGTANVLQSARTHTPQSHIVLASSAEIFGLADHSPQSETTPLAPITPYGSTKTFALELARQLRQRHDLHISNAILFNHESWRRPAKFVTTKIINGARDIAEGRATTLKLGNPASQRDWGYAGDVSRALVAMALADQPDDYVIGTGISHTVQDWVDRAFATFNLNPDDHIEIDPDFWQPAEPFAPCGNICKVKQHLHWSPVVSFDELVSSMIEQRPASADLPERVPD